jgi:hypothetical protein
MRPFRRAPVLPLLVALGLGAPARAEVSDSDTRIPLFEKGEADSRATLAVWSPGIRRAPVFLAALKAKTAEDIAVFASAAKTSGPPDATFTRYEQERMASDRFESVVVVTFPGKQPDYSGDNDPRTFDLSTNKEIGWRDLLADTSPNSRGVKTVYDFAARAVAEEYKRNMRGGTKDPKTVAGFDAAHKRMIDRLAPSLDALPPFALVPATDGRIAGLSLFFGGRSALGVHYGLEINVPAIITPIGEQFLPASVLAPYLAPAYRDLFGGEAARFSDLQRERAESVTKISGSSAVMLTEEQKPGKTLTFRAEAPASFFKDDSIEVVVDGVALREASGKHPPPQPFVAIGKAVLGAKPSGVGFDLRVFSVTINYEVDASALACRADPLHFRRAPGSLAAEAHLLQIDMFYPLKGDCPD